MRLQKSFKLAVNILLHSKLRSWLTILGIVIGVAAIVAIVSIGEGASASLNERLGGLGADMITVSPGFSRASFGGFGRVGGGGGGEGGATSNTAKNLTDKDIQAIRSVEGVKFVMGTVSGRADMIFLAQTSSVSVQGVDGAVWQNIVSTELDSGRYLNSADTNAIVIGNSIATNMFKTPLTVNRDITIDGKLFKIVGVLKAGGGGGDDNRVFMPLSAARDIIDKGNNYYDSITIKADDPNNVDAIVNATNTKLALTRHAVGNKKDFSVSSVQATLQRVQSVTQTFTLFLGAIAAVSLLVGAVGVANTMFTSVLEKTRDIGIMKSIGARNSDIMIIFLFNSGLVGFVGGIIGIALGSVVSIYLPSLISIGITPGGSLKTVLPISLLVGALVISVSIGMIAGAIPAYRASKLKPVDALRSE